MKLFVKLLTLALLGALTAEAVNGECGADVIGDMPGVDVQQVVVSGSTVAEVDAACCNACNANVDCEFWVRETGTSNVQCWLKSNWDGSVVSSATNRRGSNAWAFTDISGEPRTVGGVPVDIAVGSFVRVSGSDAAKTVHLNLFDAAGNYVFHFAGRGASSAIVENAYKGGWGAEQRPSGFPFVANQQFTMLVERTAAKFQVSINGERYPTFDFNARWDPEPLGGITKAQFDTDNIFHFQYHAGPTPSPTGAPTGSPTTAEAYADEQTHIELGNSVWKTGQVGDTVYMQNEITGNTFSSSLGNRDTFDLVDVAVANALPTSIWDNHLQHSVSDGTFTVATSGVEFQNAAGTTIKFPWDCTCASA